MSTIRVNTIQSTSTTDGGISIDSSGNITLPASTKVGTQNLPSAGPLSNRNLIINGAMQVAQRGTSTTGVSTTGYYACDRWRLPISSLGTWTVQQSTDAPNGFINSFRLLCTTADASPAAGDIVSVQQRIEAQDLQHIFTDKSAGNTSALTLSFWVKASRSGDASFSVIQVDNSSRQFNASYNIGAADTWEYKTISIPADDSAVINNDNGVGLQVMWHLHSGSNYTGGTQSANWEASTAANQNVNNLGIGQAVDDDFLITGVQLEVGSVATPFEHRSYGDELARCQRYFYKEPSQRACVGLIDGSGNYPCVMVVHPVDMRAIPSVTFHSYGEFYYNNGSQGTSWGPSGGTDAYIGDSRRGIARLNQTSTSAGSSHVHKAGQWSVQLSFSAEL